MEHLSGLPSEIQISGEEVGNRREMEMLDLYLKHAKKCTEAVQNISSLKFNNEQCQYLIEKLQGVIQSASLFLEAKQGDHHESHSSLDIERWTEIFKLLLALATQVQSFVQDCCRQEWMQAAMTLSHVSEYVSSLGFNLELCKAALCNQRSATGCRLTLVEVDNISKAEVEAIKEKASADMDSLRKLVTRIATSSPPDSAEGENRDLARYLLRRLMGVEPNPTSEEVEYLSILFNWIGSSPKPILLGTGATARVYKVDWQGIPVAKKTFFGPHNQDFMKEVGILSRLCHPNITSMFCCTMGKRSCSIIMELMDGSLHEVMQNKLERNANCPPFPILEAIDVMLQIGEGVNYLHNKHIIHRDLKSMNILVKREMDSELKVGYVIAKVVDFGLSKTKENSTTKSNMTWNTGTNNWMAPEVTNLVPGSTASCVVGSIDTPKHKFKIDIYSFAMVCYEILTGRVPFESEEIPRIVKEMVLVGKRPELPGPDHCPLMLKNLICKCWHQDPVQRPSFDHVCQKLKYFKYLLMTGMEEITDDNVEVTERLRHLRDKPCSVDSLMRSSSKKKIRDRGANSSASSTPAGQGDSSSKSVGPESMRKLSDSVYLLSEPDNGSPNVDIVLIHGLQLVGDYKEAYWKTWTVGDNETECWPMKFLKPDFPNARILSLCYDSSALGISKSGMLDLYDAGERLVSDLVEDPVNVGRNSCPVVFVCHSVGGLVAKQIVLHANEKQRDDPKYKNFLKNISGFHYYSTPHEGSQFALFHPVGQSESIIGQVIPVLGATNVELGYLNDGFRKLANGREYRDKWVSAAVGETIETRFGYGSNKFVVMEASARAGMNSYRTVDADHFGVCKPDSTTSRSYISLKNFIRKAVPTTLILEDDNTIDGSDLPAGDGGNSWWERSQFLDGDGGTSTGQGDSSSKSPAPEGIKTLISGSVYLLSEPDNGSPNVDIVLIHGLHVGDYKEAYWKTWTVGDNETECWPMKFLKPDFPNARILSLCYDSSALGTNKSGRLDLYAAGERLVSDLVEDPVNVGRNSCPVVFVCHSVGGLVAKQIVVHASEQQRDDPKYKIFLKNISGFFYYSTPHLGFQLADYAQALPYGMVTGKVIPNVELGFLNESFRKLANGMEYRDKWVSAAVGEGMGTRFGFVVVTTASARAGMDSYITVNGSDHFGVCKPVNTKWTSYLFLKNFIQEAVPTTLVSDDDYLV